VPAAVYQDSEQLPGCLGPMGIDTRNIKFVNAKDTPVSAVTALVMKAANERIFVVFKVGRLLTCSCCVVVLDVCLVYHAGLRYCCKSACTWLTTT
jgi:hypothetical protein